MQLSQLFQFPLFLHQMLKAGHIRRIQFKSLLINSVGFNSENRFPQRLFSFFFCFQLLNPCMEKGRRLPVLVLFRKMIQNPGSIQFPVLSLFV